MKKIIITLCSVVVVLSIVLAVALSSQPNSYNFITHKVNCETENICYHEATHKYDFEHGLISKSTEWKKAVNTYRMAMYIIPSKEYKTDELSFYIVFFPGIGVERIPNYNPLNTSFWTGGWGGYTELYAVIIQYTNGDMSKVPDSLREFYDVDAINNIMKGLGY